MKTKKRIDTITKWIKRYAEKHDIKCLVIGVSGGIDSAVVFTLCARTGLPTAGMSHKSIDLCF